MARLSASSSAMTSGHVKPTTPAQGVHVPVTSIETGDNDKDITVHEMGGDDDSDADNTATTTTNDPTSDSYPITPDPTLNPGGSRDLSFIGLQAFVVGIVSGAGACLTALLVSTQSPWWRLPAFFTCLGVFHFLEYWTTAAYNIPAVRASSFLLFNNGRAYTIAHTMAATEVALSNFFPPYQRWGVTSLTIAAGTVLVAVGQAVRSIAMKQAGTNFNHLVQSTRRESHTLVTTGLYATLRHPSYFGFFWWALGTQLLVGNKVCLLGYAVVLWRFFNHRIRVEEAHLTSFFGEKYEDFKKHTGTKIPFIP